MTPTARTLLLELPFPPSVNRYYRHVVIGRRVATLLSAQGRAFKADVRAAWLCGKFDKLSGRLSMRIRLHCQTRRRYDCDNFGKAVADSLQGLAYDDDSQIDILLIERGEAWKGGACIVGIEEIEV